jgi:putative heme-binding domain-containing protein
MPRMHIRMGMFVAAWLAAGSLAVAQQRFLPAEIDAGGRLYLANCTGCHGPEGDGVGGINFSQGKFRRAATDDDLIRIIVRGIPGTPMAPSGIPDNQVATIVAYLRSMTAGNGDAASGDAGRGRAIVEGKGQCLTCHSVGVNGMHAGPALTDIGAYRRGADLMRSLVDPAAEIRPENRTIRVVLKDGKTLTGRFLNQDTFSLQLIDATDKLMSIDKSSVRESTVLTTTPMPSFKEKLNAQELADVVSYLASLKGRQ